MRSVRGPLGIWVAWLAATLAAVAIGSVLFGQTQTDVTDAGPLSALWSWDAGWYSTIAHNGYPPYGSAEYGFLPFWPAFIRLTEIIGIGPWGQWLVVVAATAALFVGLARAHQLVDPAANPTRSALGFALLPGSSLLLVAYPDAIVAAAIAWSSVLAVRRPLVAVVLLALSATARLSALLGLIPAVWGSGQRSRGWRIALIVVPALALAAVLADFAVRTGDFLVFTHAQATFGRGGVADTPAYVTRSISELQPRRLIGLAFALGALVGASMLWRRGSAFRPWALLVVGALLLETLSGVIGPALPRHLALAFPLGWAIAIVMAERPRLRWPLGIALGGCNLVLAALIGVVPP